MSLQHLLADIEVPFLVEAVAFLLGVVVIVPLFKKIHVSPIIGFLIMGALIGPHNFAVVTDVKGVQHFAELGVIFLLFTIGLELSFQRLRAFSGLIFGLGAAQVLVCAAAIASVALLWGNDPKAAIIIGLCLSLSSTAMVVQLLSERRELATKYGRSSFSVLLFQDLAVVPILILLTVFGSENEGSIAGDIGFAMLNAVAAIAVIVVLGRYGLQKVFAIASRTNSIDVFTAMTLLTILAISMITGMVGLSMALGAFLAGLLLAETEFRHQIEAEIEPFKGLLLGLFFMSVGMNIDFAIAFEKGIWVLVSVLGLVSLKAIITFICALAFRLKLVDALRTSLILAEAGEFAFVVIGQATTVYGLIDPDTGQFMVVIAGISMILTPWLASLGQFIASRLESDEDSLLEASQDDDIHDHVVIAGYGRVGQAVAEVLQAEAIPYIAIDNSADSVKLLRLNNKSVYVGDATRMEMLKRTGIDRAAALLITMNSPEHALHTLSVARRYWPNLHIIVRSRDTSHSAALIAAGANQVVPETLEASLQLSGYILRASGYSREEASLCVDLARQIKFNEENLPPPTQTL